MKNKQLRTTECPHLPIRLYWAFCGSSWPAITAVGLLCAPYGSIARQPEGAKVPTTAIAAVRVERAISGKVTGDNGEVLPGVSIQLKGTNRGTTTDATGSFRLTVPDEGSAVLVFSFIGYVSQEITVGNQSIINVTLASDNKALAEVVVVGYGTQKKADLTGAVSAISASDFDNTINTNVGQALQGRAAGVQVTQNTGKPGDNAIIRVRGVGTTGNSNALYVIDGVITDGGIANINPDDIESMTVLKDAASSAIYGARAANGVVLITTKRGKTGVGRVSFTMYYGTQKAWRLPRMANAREFATLQNEARQNAGLTPYWNNPDSLGVGNDKIGEIFQTAPIQNYHVSVSGGSEKSQYAVSLGYFNQVGIGIGVGYDRYSLNVTSDHQVLKKLKFGNSLSLTRGKQTSGQWNETFVNAIRFSPTIPKYMPDGNYGYGSRPGEQIGYLSSLGSAYLFQNDLTRYRLLGNIYGEYQFTPELKLRATIGADFILENGINFVPTYAFGGRTNVVNTLDRSNVISTTWLNENLLSYDKAFGKHSISALAGITQQANRYDNFSAHRESFPNNDIRVLDAGALNDRARGSASEWSIRSFLSRVNYNYDERYLVSANLRVDGSSRFGTGNRYGVFPSFAAGWRISGEKFMENIRAINDLKLRASWGQLGNQEIGLYSFTTGLNLGQNYVLGSGQTVAPGVAPTALGNPNIKWETTTMQDVGIDLALLNNRVSVTADYFIKDTRDMLVQVPIPGTTGVTTAPYQNVGAVRNSGFELAITYRKASGDFKYDISANMGTIKNRVTALAGLPIISGVFKTAEGQPISSIFGYVQEGVFQNQSEIDAHATQLNAKPGDIKWKDSNGDGIINDLDRDYIGNTIPRLSYGFTGNANYKGFDLSVFIQGIQGRDLYLDGTGGRRLMDNFDNTTAEYLSRWTGPGTSNRVPRLVWGDPSNNRRTSSFWVYDASYLRIRNVQLGYTLPKGTLGLGRLRIYASCQNLLTITSYPWFDPEVGAGIDNNFTDLMTYPQPRTILGGINIDF
ncbi:SusC/RagA family TonB-linked outer membrane protein [Spirosoma linguale]|uniref:TonB-dependent receptor n=1 Tax=Spirosoma linguale (strain ATCC 33905 / DSM 74 / LMG 10896 / Claus 1) TaxID=504472 RepID=D2QIV6_SPILD|nr:TonB-dependent receptor [Spirosoma linguale DSM 74]